MTEGSQDNEEQELQAEDTIEEASASLDVDALSAVQETEYEFNASQNEVFSELGLTMRYGALAWMTLALVVALMFVQMMDDLETVNLGLAILVTATSVVTLLSMGWWTWGAAGSVYLVVRTEGRDITHLMRGVKHLRRLFWVQVWLLLIMAVAGVGTLAMLTL